MYSHLVVVAASALSFFEFLEPRHLANCDAPAQLVQARDAATVRRLVTAWETSERTGDIAFGKCLLDRGFVGILADGKIETFAGELEATSRRANGHSFTSDRSEITVLMHGNAAVAYGRRPAPLSRNHRETIPFADYLVWENSSWHAYFSNQTKVRPQANWQEGR